MAKALQCPACGATTRIDAVPTDGTFACESCGQVMKVPPGLMDRPARRESSAAPAAAPAATVSSVSSGAAASSAGSGPLAAPPAPPRRSRAAAAAATGAVAAAASAAAAAPAPRDAGGSTSVLEASDLPGPTPPAPRGARRASGPRRETAVAQEALPLWARILAWVVALPMGLAIVGIPARKLGYLTSQKLLDVIVKHDLGRFVPIFVIVALWALVTAGLVTLFVEGGRWLLARRRARAAVHAEHTAIVGNP
jgi:hypothetical protein